ncbi:MAG: aldehyde dehydrogenase family protein [Pseudomonadota bacterium]
MVTLAKINSVFVDGAWRVLDESRSIPLVDPHTEEITGVLSCATAEVVSDAVRAATRALRFWEVSRLEERASVLRALFTIIEQRRAKFAKTISAEIGAPIDFARTSQIDAAISHLEATIAALDEMQVAEQSSIYSTHQVIYEPIGVAALITPWNWPLNQVILKVAATIAAGCTCVLKPSEFSSRTAMLLAECLSEAGVPKGVFNLVLGDRETGADLVSHSDVDAVSLTGSSRAGREIARMAAARPAHCSLELGGKSPNLIFADCNLEKAIRQGLAHCYRNSGQSCNAASRMLVERSRYEEAVDLAAALAGAVEVGPPHRAGQHLGPLVNRAQFDHVQNMIRGGIETGLRLVVGGAGRPQGFMRGFYAKPTVFADVEPDNSLFQTEIFGPVLTMTPFDDEEHAVELANATRYGLAGYIQTSDPARAKRVSDRLKVGMVQINGTSRAPGAPFGGRKASGYGREGGLWGIREFQNTKSVSGLV